MRHMAISQVSLDTDRVWAPRSLPAPINCQPLRACGREPSERERGKRASAMNLLNVKKPSDVYTVSVYAASPAHELVKRS